MSLDSGVKEHYAALREQSKRVREERRLSVPQKLDDNNIKYESKNKGAHLIIANRWDLWPGTGKWRDRKANKYKHGVDYLISEIKKS